MTDQPTSGPRSDEYLERRTEPFDEGSDEALEQPLGKAMEDLRRGQRSGDGDSSEQDAELPQEGPA